MKKRKQVKSKILNRQQGMALIMAMMSLLLLSGLGMAVLFNASGDVAITGSFRRNEQAFFAADAGIGLARELLRVQLNNAIQTRAQTALSSLSFQAGATSFNHAAIKQVLGRKSDGSLDADLFSSSVTTSPVATTIAAANQRGSALGSNRNFNFSSSAITLTLDTTFDANESTTTNPGCVPGDGIIEGPLATNITNPPITTAMPRSYYFARYRYSITSQGNFTNPSGTLTIATASASEVGYVTVQLNSNISGNAAPPVVFSGFGSFWNRNGLTASNQYFSGGTYSGPTHINEWYRFHPSISYRFKDVVTQGGSSSTTGTTYQWYNGSSNANLALPSGNPATSPGTNLVFESTFSKVDTMSIPTNTYNQQKGVLDGIGLGTAPTAADLGAGLSTPSQAHPDVSSGSLPSGVYLSSTDNANITGGGIYVKGNADDIKLSTNSGSQVYEITQGSTVTKITVTITNASTGAGTTTVQVGSGTAKTFNGVPMDKRDSTNLNAATLLYVDGAVSSLHGPTKTGTGTAAVTAPAIASNTKLTITGTSDISITGDLKYTDQTVNNDGTPITANQNATNILGIYTATGKVIYDPVSSWTAGANLDLTIDAAITAFNEPALTNATTADDYTGGRGDCVRCLTNGFDKTKATLYHRGSSVFSQDLLWTNGFGSWGSKSMNLVFDPRMRGGAKAPPWYPGSFAGTLITQMTLSFTTSNVASVSNTWQRLTGN